MSGVTRRVLSLFYPFPHSSLTIIQEDDTVVKANRNFISFLLWLFVGGCRGMFTIVRCRVERFGGWLGYVRGVSEKF